MLGPFAAQGQPAAAPGPDTPQTEASPPAAARPQGRDGDIGLAPTGPDFSAEASWGEMTVDELARLMGRRLQRPAPRPEGFETAVKYLPRARPRPSWLEAEALAQSQGTTQAEAEAQMALLEAAQDEAARLAARHGVTPAAPTAAGADATAAPAAPLPATASAPLPATTPGAPAASAALSAPAPGVAEAPAQLAAATPQAQTEEGAAAGAAAVPLPTASTPGQVPPPGPSPMASAPAADAPVLVPVPVAAAAATPDSAARVATAPRPDLAAEPLPLLHSTGFKRDTYATDRATREEIYLAAEGEARISAALDLTQFNLAHMLLPEARDYHSRAQGQGVQLYPELHRRWRVQATMLDTLQGRKLSQPMPEGWRDASLWAIAGKAAPGLIAGRIDLAEAIAALQHQSEPVVSRLLPELFDAALSAGDLRSADSLLRGAREATTLTGETVYPLMMGRLALAYDMPEQAFDYFAKAADGRDLSAQRARIAMADLAIARRDVRLLPALAEILREGVNQWRYGQEGLILRARLAQVAEDLGDIPLALDIMGRIRTDHPGTAEAVLAHERGALALAAFALAVDHGEIGLETYLQSLRHVESFYRLDPIWPIARSALGRAWTRAGLHVAAASEYAALQNDLARVGAPEPSPHLGAAIPLDEAEAWLRNHETSRAKVALARQGLPQFSDLAGRFGVAALQAGMTGAVGSAADFDAPADLQVLAEAARAAGQLGVAHGAHRALLLRGHLAKSPAEALRATLLAHDLAEPDFAQLGLADLRAAPLGQASAVTPALSAALLAPMPGLSPLSQSIADTMLGRSAAAIEATQALLARPLLAPEPLAAWAAERAPAQVGTPQDAPTRVE